MAGQQNQFGDPSDDILVAGGMDQGHVLPNTFGVISPAVRLLMNTSHRIFHRLQVQARAVEEGVQAEEDRALAEGGGLGVGGGAAAGLFDDGEAMRAAVLGASKGYRDALRSCVTVMYAQDQAEEAAVAEAASSSSSSSSSAAARVVVPVREGLPHLDRPKGVAPEDYEELREYLEKAQETLHLCEIFLLDGRSVVSPQLLDWVQSYWLCELTEREGELLHALELSTGDPAMTAATRRLDESDEYWELLFMFLIRGQAEDAARLLRLHSGCMAMAAGPWAGQGGGGAGGGQIGDERVGQSIEKIIELLRTLPAPFDHGVGAAEAAAASGGAGGAGSAAAAAAAAAGGVRAAMRLTEAYEIKHKEWQRGAHDLLEDPDLRGIGRRGGGDRLVEVVQMLSGNEAVICQRSQAWFDYLSGLLLFKCPLLTRPDAARILDQCLQHRGSGAEGAAWEPLPILRVAADSTRRPAHAALVLEAAQQSLGGLPWLGAHLSDLMAKSGLLDEEETRLPAPAEHDLREEYLRAYAKTLTAAAAGRRGGHGEEVKGGEGEGKGGEARAGAAGHMSDGAIGAAGDARCGLWEVAVTYLAACPADAAAGGPLLQAVLAAVAPSSDALAMRLQRACARHGLLGLRDSVATARAMAWLDQGRTADAVRWLSRAGDKAQLAAVASRIVRLSVDKATATAFAAVSAASAADAPAVAASSSASSSSVLLSPDMPTLQACIDDLDAVAEAVDWTDIAVLTDELLFLGHFRDVLLVMRDARLIEHQHLSAAAVASRPPPPAAAAAAAAAATWSQRLAFLEGDVVTRLAKIMETRCAPDQYWPRLLLLWYVLSY